MVFQHLIDPAGAALVAGGTLLATLARVGWRDSLSTACQIGGLFRSPFDPATQRATLAGKVQRMRRDGIISVDIDKPSDPYFAELAAILSRQRSTKAMLEEHCEQRKYRERKRARAIDALERAGDLAPVLGLAGTLIALSQLSPAAFEGNGEVMGSISLAVISTFYGLLFAHLLFLPLAGAIARRGQEEEEDRQALVEWLAEQLEPASAHKSPRDRMAA